MARVVDPNKPTYRGEKISIAVQARLIEHEQMLNALKNIREMGYNSQAFKCTETVLAILRVTEETIREVEC
jgi:hypothetical protein